MAVWRRLPVCHLREVSWVGSGFLWRWWSKPRGNWNTLPLLGWRNECWKCLHIRGEESRTPRSEHLEDWHSASANIHCLNISIWEEWEGRDLAWTPCFLPVALTLFPFFLRQILLALPLASLDFSDCFPSSMFSTFLHFHGPSFIQSHK